MREKWFVAIDDAAIIEELRVHEIPGVALDRNSYLTKGGGRPGAVTQTALIGDICPVCVYWHLENVPIDCYQINRYSEENGACEKIIYRSVRREKKSRSLGG